MGLKISARVRQSSVTSNTLWANFNFFGQIIIQRYLFLCPRWSSGPYISRNFLTWTHFVNASWKTSDLHTHISSTYNSRKLVDVFLKVRFTIMYSSRKLNNNKKVINTACNFWRQIVCSFQVYGCTNHFCAKSTRKTLFWISRFFHPTNIDVTSCFFRQCFRPLYENKGQKTAIFNCEYLGDTCFNWAESS